MKIKQFEIVDRCLFWKTKSEKILIVGDLHLGYEEYLNERGWSFPKTQLEESFEIFGRIFKKIGKVNKIILLGDVKHYFSGVLKYEFSDFWRVMGLLRKNLLKNGWVIITKGNHDNILEPVVKNYLDVKLVDFYVLDDVVFFHGDKFGFGGDIFNTRGKIDEKIKLLIVAHFHPAVTISEGGKSGRREKYRCFLYGKLKQLKKQTIILPSFFPLTEGSDITQHHQLRNKGLEKKGLWKRDRYDISEFRVFVLDSNGEVYDFGKVKDLDY